MERQSQSKATAIQPNVAKPSATLALVVAPVAALLAAWIAGGSVGLLGHALRHALTWLALTTVVVAAWPDGPRRATWLPTAAWILSMAAAIGMTAVSFVPINVLAPAVLLAGVSAVRPSASRNLRLAAIAVAVLGAYRLANTSIPALWLATDRLGGAMGSLAGRVTGQPLWVGATFGGLDVLIAMAVLYGRWVCELPAARWRNAVLGAVWILAAQFSYLLLLAASPVLLDWLTAPAQTDEWLRPWIARVAPWKELLPWNLPALAAIFQGGVAAAMFWRLREDGTPPRTTTTFNGRLATAVAGLAAALLPVVTVLVPTQATFTGKKVVSYEQGFLNWLKPTHGDYGRLSIGMYGMFGPLVESLGGRFQRSPDLSEQDLADADLLVLFYPTRTLDDAQLRRVQQYVERGGTLLLMCDHTACEPVGDDPFKLGDSRFNDLLQPTSIRVAFDAAEFAIGGWLQSYEALAHPATTGIDDDRNIFGVVIGASLEVGWPARPILIGRWGYADLGDEGSSQAMLGNGRYDPGEKLGDMILAAEQRWGQGRVLVFGDTSSLINGIVVGSHPFVTRLLAYSAGDSATPQAPWRQVAGGALVLVIVGLLLWRPSIERVTIVALALSASLAISTAVTLASTEVVPTGTHAQPNNLAYLDTAHLGSYSEESTRPDGTFGLQYTLMRNDYLVLSLYELTYQRLSQAGLLVSAGPQRAFTVAERQAIQRFVEEGGIFILMTGYERSAASRELLRDFGFTVGAIPPNLPASTEPIPLGHFKSPYYDGGTYLAQVRFHAAWPISCNDPAARTIAQGVVDRTFDPVTASFRMEGKVNLPVIIVRNVGAGKVAVIGDTDFATNKNLENEDGSPIEGLRENADFWRWFLADLRGLPPWNPPPPQPEAPPADNPSTAPAPSPPSPPAAADPAEPAADKSVPPPTGEKP